MSPRNKKVLIIGGTSSLASKIIECAQVDGYELYCTTRRNKFEDNHKVTWLNLKLESLDSISDLLTQIREEKFERIIVLLGAVTNRDYFQIQYEEIAEYYRTYLTNLNYLFTKLISHLEELGNILLMSSRAASNPSFDAHYSAVKSGLEGYVRSSVRVLSPMQSAVTVSSGLILNSSMYKDMDESIRESHEERSQGKLLELEEAGSLLWALTPDKTIGYSGTTIRIGPDY